METDQNQYLIIRKIIFLILFAGFLIFPACSKWIFPVYPIPEYSGSMTWEMVTKKAEWQGRWDHASISFDDKIWIFGGFSSGEIGRDNYLEDVWSSEDGHNWKMLTDSAPWGGRRGHSVVVLKNNGTESVLLIGGFSVDEETGIRQYNNDVWETKDGINWELIKPNSKPPTDSDTDWYPRFNHRCEIMSFDGTDHIILIAGATIKKDSPAYQGMEYLNDLWISSDGTSWKRLNNDDIGIRSEHASCIDVDNNKLYVQGGTFGKHDPEGSHLDKPVYQWQELWSTADGINWEAENDVTGFHQEYLYRSQHEMISYQGKIWCFPGKSSSSVHYSKNPDTYSIWTVDKVGKWGVDSEGPPFMPRYGYSLIFHDNSIFIIGGHTADKGPSNEVWIGKI